MLDKIRGLSVFIITNTLNPGGAEKQAVLLAKQLKQHFATRIIVYYGEKCDDKLLQLVEQNDIDVIFLNGAHMIKFITLLNLFRNNKSRSIIFSYLAFPNLINALIGGIAGVNYRIGGIRSSRMSIIKMVIQRFLHNHILTGSVFNNYLGKEIFTNKGFLPNKSFVIPNCIEIQQDPTSNIKSNDPIIILSVGRFLEVKDYKTAIYAVGQLKKQLNRSMFTCSLKYLIIGYGNLETQIRNWVYEYGLEHEVEIVINPPDIASYYSQADIYLSTSLFEGLSNSIMEAMEYSLHVVATNVGDNKSLIIENETGYLVPVGDYSTIASKLFSLITDNDLMFQMGLKGYYHLKENYSEEIFKNRYLDLINKIISSKV